MTPMLRVALLAAVAASSIPSSGAAQAVFPEANGKVLAGVKAVDARAIVATWLKMDSDKDRVSDNIQAAFELALRRDGVIVDASAPNFLLCELKFAQSGGLVAYTYEILFYSFEREGVHRLLWNHGGIVTIGRNNFDPDDVGKTCTDTFSREWLRWNPR